MKAKPPVHLLHTTLGIAVLAWLVTGCQVATSVQPIGTTPVSTTSLNLDGIWQAPDGQPFFVRTLDDAAGRLEVANVTTNDQGFRLERHEVLVRKHQDTLFANLRSLDPQPEDAFTFGRLTLMEHALILNLAPAAPLRKLALDGAFQATITTNRDGSNDSYSVLVTGDFDRLASRLAAPDGWRWLETANPIVLTRPR